MAKTKNSVTESLAKELKTLIPKLDAQGLAFLVQQAKVHIYNMQVDELNKASLAVNKASICSVSAANKTQKPQSKTIKNTNFKIDPTSSGFYLRYGGTGTMFSKNEMTHLIKIVNGQGTELEKQERIFNWLIKERKDVFSLVPFENKFDKQLKTFAAYIKKNFKLKK